MNIPEMVKLRPELAFKLNEICRILTEDGYYPPAEVWETAVAIATEVLEA